MLENFLADAIVEDVPREIPVWDDQAIHCIYNQYEIACYADGIIEAIVS